MTDGWLWFCVGIALFFGFLQLFVPEWLVWKQNQHKQAETDRKWAEKPHKEVECDECSRISCEDCDNAGFRHDPTCSRYYPSL